MSAAKPQVNSASQKELDKCEKQFEEFNDQVQSMTMDRMSGAKKVETEEQTKLSQKEIQKKNELYLKPKRSIASQEKFNEKFRDDYNYSKEYVNFIAENHEVIGESIDAWTKPFPGLPAEEWSVPANKPVWAPRYVAEQIKKCNYHVFSMSEAKGQIGSDQMGTYTGSIIVDSIKQRLDARPINTTSKSIFMGASGF
jgi:hypothetical protein